MAPLVYAGVGARKTPEPVLAVMRRMAWYLVEKGWHLNTGGADGADTAFVEGSPVAVHRVPPLERLQRLDRARVRDVHRGVARPLLLHRRRPSPRLGAV